MAYFLCQMCEVRSERWKANIQHPISHFIKTKGGKKWTNKSKNNVGVAALGDPQNGITLVALVITIIVMLILVGVTVTGAINGGLIGTSQEAKYKTQISQIKEALEEEIINRKASKESVEDITIEDLEISDKLKEIHKKM